MKLRLTLFKEKLSITEKSPAEHKYLRFDNIDLYVSKNVVELENERYEFPLRLEFFEISFTLILETFNPLLSRLFKKSYVILNKRPSTVL